VNWAKYSTTILRSPHPIGLGNLLDPRVKVGRTNSFGLKPGPTITLSEVSFPWLSLDVLFVFRFFFFEASMMRASKKLDWEDVCVRRGIDSFRKLGKVSYINKIKKIDKVDTRKSNERRFLLGMKVSSTSWNRVTMREVEGFELYKMLSFLNKFLNFLVYKEEKKLK